MGAAGDKVLANLPTLTGEPVREGEHEPGQVVAALRGVWDWLRIPEKRGTVSKTRSSERTLLARRLAELGRRELELAILGVTATPWMMDGSVAYAACARVFGSTETTKHFAKRGLAELERRRGKPANDSPSGGAPSC